MIVHNYLAQAVMAAKWMDEERAKHPNYCVIWLLGDVCDCERGVERWREP